MAAVARFISFFKPRPIPRVAFLVHTPELFNHFEPIWEHLKSEQFDVLLLGDALCCEETAARMVGINVRQVSDVLAARDRYQVLVSNHPVNLTGQDTPRGKQLLIKKLAVTNLRMMYAAGKSGWNMSDWNKFYDGVLCFGPHHARIFSKKFGLPVMEIGYPRFDRYFNDPLDISELQRRFFCNPEKSTIVWLPTWKTLSSVDHFNSEITSLLSDYNVVVKVHPLMPESEPSRVKALEKLGFNSLISDARDNVPLYQLADYMLFDYGGPAFGGIYTSKRFVLLNVPQAENDLLTGRDSPDILLRRDVLNVNPGEGALRPLLQDDSHWDRQNAVIKRLRRDYFAENFGTSAASAAQAITDLSWLGRKGRPRW